MAIKKPTQKTARDNGFSPERLERLRDWAKSYIDKEKLPCTVIAIMRHGELVFEDHQGFMNVSRETMVNRDTLFRIFSMTKPITNVAAMSLYEEGRFQLDDPVSKFIPCLKNMTVLAKPGGDVEDTVPAQSEITIRQLMTHTSGFIYSFSDPSAPLCKLYTEHQLDFNAKGAPLAEWIETLAKLPLGYQPGAKWEYSISTDVLGHLLEVIAKQPLDQILKERILDPLKMKNTSFEVADQELKKFPTLYKYKNGDRMAITEEIENSQFRAPVSRFQGGGGLISTTGDYLRFLQMMLNEGELDGVRILGRKTVEYMTMNHLPGDIASMGQPRFGESVFEGVGFGLGFAIMMDPTQAQLMASVGEYNWGGAAHTVFWNDPAEDLSVVFMTQLTPSETYPLKRELRILVNQAIID